MNKRRVLINRFDTWTEILFYLDTIRRDYIAHNIKYNVDVFYNAVYNCYKVRVEV